jgi:hypothetical protein
MNRNATQLLRMGTGVADFLRQKKLEAAFETVCRIARECYPEFLEQEAELLEDVDESGLFYVRLFTLLPTNYPVEEAVERSREYARRVVEGVPYPARECFHHLTTFPTDA